jgi:histidyl-tRNA synthetase
MAKLEVQGYRGTRDFYPEEFRKRDQIYSSLKATLKSFGYEEYAGPLVEPLELYASKSSEEIVSKQLYSFVDRGNRQIAIRPEMTPTLARMVAAKNASLVKPLRWFSIPQCMRYERPQRGRLREFDQLNVDIFGGNSVDEDIEVLQLVVKILDNLGATPNMYEVRINHRKILNELLYSHLKFSHNLQRELIREIDRRDKISKEEFELNLKNLGASENQIESLQCFFNSFETQTLPEFPEFQKAWKEVQLVLQVLKDLGISTVKFNPTIMRGFDYYTGLVFEVFDKHPQNNRAMFGGGRYDNLIEAFGSDSLSGIGFGAGDVPLIHFCESHGLLKDENKPLDVVVCRFSENDRTQSFVLAEILRAQQLNIENSVSDSKFGKQIQSAEKRGATCVAFRGEEEVQKNEFCVKFLKTGEQKNYLFSEVGALEFKKALKEF